MDVIGDAPYFIASRIEFAAKFGQIAVHSFADILIEERMAIFSGENDVKDDVGMGLRHFLGGLRFESRLQRYTSMSTNTLGRCPRLGLDESVGLGLVRQTAMLAPMELTPGEPCFFARKLRLSPFFILR